MDVNTSAKLNAHDIRFSQNSVNGMNEIKQSMLTNGWKGDPIDVVYMPDGRLTTIDNTRVVAAREAGISVTARIHHYDELLPKEFIDRFTTKQGVPLTWGDAIRLRVANQSASFRKNGPYGAYDLEKVR